MNPKDKQIVDVVLQLFSEKGPKFRMEDVAKELKISKRTIYEEYGNKENLISLIVEAIFESIEKQLEKIMATEEYTTLDKLIHLTCAFPDVKDIDYHKAMMIKDDFPKQYDKFIHYIEDNWNLSRSLFNQCIQEGLIKPSDHGLFRIAVLGITKQVLSMDDVDQELLLEQCIQMLFDGLKIDKIKKHAGK